MVNNIKKTRNYKLKQRLSHFISVMEVAIILKRPDLNPNINEPVLLISGTHCVI